MVWRLIEDDGATGRPGAQNMALDQVLFESVLAGGPPAIRFYSWEPPCLSVGRNQRLAGGPLDPERIDGLSVDLVRRPTGGAAVLHDQELTYAVALPIECFGSLRGSYQAINKALVGGLRQLGVDASVAPALEGRPGGGYAQVCFQAAAPGEVVAGGAKLVGSAQRREGRCLLQHGSLLLAGGQRQVGELLRGEGAPLVPVATLQELLGYVPAWADLVNALRAGFERSGIRFTVDSLTPTERNRVAELTGHFGSEAWTWRL